jgi:hypothetical protein
LLPLLLMMMMMMMLMLGPCASHPQQVHRGRRTPQQALLADSPYYPHHHLALPPEPAAVREWR